MLNITKLVEVAAVLIFMDFTIETQTESHTQTFSITSAPKVCSSVRVFTSPMVTLCC